MKLTELVQWVDTHWYQILLSWALLVALWKVIPEEKRTAIEKRYPRLVNTVRALYSFGPDLIKTVAALKAVWTGKPKSP